MAEKLFNLPISKFPELVAMEELNKKYDQIYNIYREYMETIREFSLMSWNKLDAQQLITSADKYGSMVRKLGNKLTGADQMFPFTKLKDQISGFKESLPLIEQLKNPAIQERHWKRIMEETGKATGEINLKTMTLGKVFELELQHHEDKVTEICIEAGEEARNEENIQLIEQSWKVASFNI